MNAENNESINASIVGSYPPYRVGWFVVMFALIYGLFEFLYFKIPDLFLVDVIYHYGLASPCVGIINFLHAGENAIAARNMLLSNGVSLEIVRGCDGAGTIFLLAAAIITFSASFKDKIVGLVSGIALLVVINLLRIVGLYFVMSYHSQWFTPIHTYFAPTFIIIISCLFFAGWAQYAAKRKQ